MTTPYHARYWARLLTVGGERGSVAQLGRSLASARLDINPHQIDAALFAIRSPLAQGCLLADEVGLGKTIEAGLVIAQRWAERRRRILLILPATLRKQWQLELAEKFGLPSLIMEGRTYNAAAKDGKPNPFDIMGQVVICSYPFAARRAEDIMTIPWDLVVLDEAHRLRNVWKSGTKQAPAIRTAIEGRPKLLLTATPLQNSLMELYGLVSFVDDHVFGDIESFKERFVGGFRYYKLGPSLITQDQWGREIIAPEYRQNTAMLIEAMCKLHGYTFRPSDTHFWMHGQSTETDFIYVTTESLSKDQIAFIAQEVGDERSLLICCGSHRLKDISQFPNVTVTKIPKSVLEKCEWGKDDYSLKIRNLPLAEDVPEAIPESEQEEAKQDPPKRKRGRPSKAKAEEPNQMTLFGGRE